VAFGTGSQRNLAVCSRSVVYAGSRRMFFGALPGAVEVGVGVGVAVEVGVGVGVGVGVDGES